MSDATLRRVGFQQERTDLERTRQDRDGADGRTAYAGLPLSERGSTDPQAWAHRRSQFGLGHATDPAPERETWEVRVSSLVCGRPTASELVHGWIVTRAEAVGKRKETKSFFSC